MNAIVGSHDILFVTLDTLRYDVAAELLAAGRTPALARLLPPGGWERRHTPASFTYAAHHAFFAGFLPTPPTPGTHRRLFAAGFAGSATVDSDTWVFDGPDVVSALAQPGLPHRLHRRRRLLQPPLGVGPRPARPVRRGHWEPEFGVTEPQSTRYQVDRVEQVVRTVPTRPLFVFLNVSALHQPNRFYLPGASDDSRETHAAALEYVDGQVERLFSDVDSRGRPCFAIVCSDHGTAYGEDGHTGHRFAHESVWTVPYAALSAGAPCLTARPYQGYLYAYPHKTAYRPLRPRPSLSEVWAGERARPLFPLPARAVLRDAVRLLQPLHPVEPARPSRCAGYLDQLQGRSRGHPRCAWDSLDSSAGAIGGGTPTYLTAAELRAAVRHHRHDVAAEPPDRCGGDVAGHRHAPTGWPCSPTAARTGSASACRASSTPRPTPPAGRSAAPMWTERCGDPRRRHPGAEHRPDLRHRRADATDLGGSRSARRLVWRPEELYLYPLYVRPLTGPGHDAPASRDGLGPPAARPLPRGSGSVAGRRLPAALDAPVPSRRRWSCRRSTTPARTTAWSDWGAGPGRTPGSCTTRSTTRSACAGCGRSWTTIWPPCGLRARRGGFRAGRAGAAPALAGEDAAAGRRHESRAVVRPLR